jgi:hypothetical protein
MTRKLTSYEFTKFLVEVEETENANLSDRQICKKLSEKYQYDTETFKEKASKI